MEPVRRGDSGPAAAEVRATLASLGLVGSGPHGDSSSPDSVIFDAACELAIREFQQQRGLTIDGVVGTETWSALVAARWRLGDRPLTRSVTDPLVGDDVEALQERLLEMGYDVGRPDGVFGAGTERALQQFQREVGLLPDGSFGPSTMRALRQLGRKVVGGRPQLLRETALLRQAGPALVGKHVVIDPGHGGPDRGVVVPDGMLEWSEAELAWDLANRLEGRLSALGVRTDLSRGRDTWFSDADRARFANEAGADVLVSLHIDGHRNPEASGVATYYFGTQSGASSTVGERLAGLVHREIVARTGLVDGRTHRKTWEILRRTRMPTVRVECGYLTSPVDRARLIEPAFRDTIAEAILIAVQRVFLPVEVDFKTGTMDMRELRSRLA